MLPFIIVYIALCLVGIGVPISYAICLAVADKQGKVSSRALRRCCQIFVLFGIILTLFAYWTLHAPFEEPQRVIAQVIILLILLLLTGTAAALLADLPLPKVLRRHTFPLAFCLVTNVPFLLVVALFTYTMEHPSGGGDGMEQSQDIGVGE